MSDELAIDIVLASHLFVWRVKERTCCTSFYSLAGPEGKLFVKCNSGIWRLDSLPAR